MLSQLIMHSNDDDNGVRFNLNGWRHQTKGNALTQSHWDQSKLVIGAVINESNERLKDILTCGNVLTIKKGFASRRLYDTLGEQWKGRLKTDGRVAGRLTPNWLTVAPSVWMHRISNRVKMFMENTSNRPVDSIGYWKYANSKHGDVHGGLVYGNKQNGYVGGCEGDPRLWAIHCTGQTAVTA